jgi:hypothetical protein
MNFKQFAQAVEKQFKKMSKHPLFIVEVEKNDIWDRYLEAYPKGRNPLYKERREHDCQTCKQFIRNIGNVVAIINDEVVSIWDIKVDDEYQIVSDALSVFVHSQKIKTVFLHFENRVGAKDNNQILDDGAVIKWNHFHCLLPRKFVSDDRDSIRGEVRTTIEVFKRGLEELTLDALERVKQLISDNALYKGDEFKNAINIFINLKKDYAKAENKEIFIWKNHVKSSARLRNSVIGTLVQDLSENKDLEVSVKAFEDKVAPSNYKRSSALITQGMIDKASEVIMELDIEASLHRRLAIREDVSINNVLFADRSTAKHMKGSIGDILSSAVKKPIKPSKEVIEIGIEDFIATVVPKVDSIEAFVENKHSSNLMTLVSPQEVEAKNIFQWDNNFSWSYHGNITDCMKERVKSAGGRVDGVLRFSIQWNEEGNEANNDLDAHCYSPKEHIYYSNKAGHLDVDITRPQNNIAVENITWDTIGKMKEGEYKFVVNNYSGRNVNGFRAEIEMDGIIHSFDYANPVTSDVVVGIVKLKNKKFTLDAKLDSTESTKTIWNIQSNHYAKINMMMLSPNHWDGQKCGNKHYFFMLEKCQNPEKVRGFYNEFLMHELLPHRKTFEVLSSKMMCENSDTQLSGLGFSSTQRNTMLLRTKGTLTRAYKIQF